MACWTNQLTDHCLMGLAGHSNQPNPIGWRPPMERAVGWRGAHMLGDIALLGGWLGGWGRRCKRSMGHRRLGPETGDWGKYS